MNVAFNRTYEDEEDFMNSAIGHNGARQPDGSFAFAEQFSLQGTNTTKLTVMSRISMTVNSP